jgi:lysophospholipase L1-like esterase
VRSRVSIPLGVLATSVATGAVVSGQVLWARKRDLPSVVGADVSGSEGDPSLPRVVVACAGDSTLTGPGLADPRQTWVRLAARSVSNERHVDVRSFAIGGAKVGDVLDQQLDAVLAVEADVAVVAVGSNDVLGWTPVQEVESAFRLLVTTLSERVPRVVIGGVGDLGLIARIPAPLSSVVSMRARQVDRIIRRACQKPANVSYVDVSCTDGAFRAGGRHVFTVDLFHPNEIGHSIWAGVAGPVLAHAIRAVDPKRPASPSKGAS